MRSKSQAKQRTAPDAPQEGAPRGKWLQRIEIHCESGPPCSACRAAASEPCRAGCDRSNDDGDALNSRGIAEETGETSWVVQTADSGDLLARAPTQADAEAVVARLRAVGEGLAKP